MTREEARLAVRQHQIKRQRRGARYGFNVFVGDEVLLENGREIHMTYSKSPGSNRLQVVRVYVRVDNRKESEESIAQWFKRIFGTSPKFSNPECSLSVFHAQSHTVEVLEDGTSESWTNTEVSMGSTTFDGWAQKRNDRTPPEQFASFLDRFVDDEGFRVSRIEFPLNAVLGNPTNSPIKERWSKAQLPDKLAVPAAIGRPDAAELNQMVLYRSESDVELQQSQSTADRSMVIYRFELKKGKWFLVEFEKGSYQ